MREIRITVISVFLFVFAFFTGFSQINYSFSMGAPANEAQGDVKKSYFGRIGEEEILLDIIFMADKETVKGHYYYKGKLESFALEGSLDIYGRIWLHSPYKSKDDRYTLAGLYINSKEVDGFYQKNSEKAIPMMLNEERVPKPVKLRELAWVGKWYRNKYRFQKSEMEITQLTDRVFYYYYRALNGGASDGYGGFARIEEGNNSFAYNPSGDKLSFEFDQGTVVVKKADGGRTHSMSGAPIDGVYSREDRVFTAMEIEDEFVDRGVFTEEQNLLFKEMVGEYLPLFTYAFHALGESKDLDSGTFKVFHMWVRGNYSYYHGIIIVNDQNEIWAAAVDSKTRIIHCFTNTKSHDKFPLTMQEWKKTLHEKGIIYH